MAKRKKLEKETEPDDIYGFYEKTDYFTTGCTLLDCALGGGWAERRVANVVGNKSSGKTQLCIEAAANFMAKYPEGRVIYAETEAAFDMTYAKLLGLPLEHVEFPRIQTVEAWFDDLYSRTSADQPTLAVLDSLDALGSAADYEDDGSLKPISDGGYRLGKPKGMSLLFQRLVKLLAESHVTVLVASQIRDIIGVTFGEKHTRSGGRALDFYSSQILWLNHLKQLPRTSQGEKRTVGVQVKATCKKNKAGSPWRNVEFPILFNFGIEDVVAGLEWLKKTGHTDLVELTEVEAKKTLSRVHKMESEEYLVLRDKLVPAVKELWQAIEDDLAPLRQKYQT